LRLREIQAWFARSDHPQAKDPYFLYAASNIGSFAALIAYPLVVEPFLTLRDQSRWWMSGFAALAAFIALCAMLTGRQLAGQAAPAAKEPVGARTQVPTSRERLAWIGLSFVPSGLLVAVTAHISTDVAAAPLLWVAPLALFLLTFVLAFRETPTVGESLLRRMQAWGTALAFFNLVVAWPLGPTLCLHLGLFFINAMVCHGALYRRRPPPRRLTEFYLCLSAGGVLGGIFCGLLAPHLFSTVLEYAILLVAALFCWPGFVGRDRKGWFRKSGGGLLACAVAILGGLALAKTGLPAGQIWLFLIILGVVLMMVVWRESEQLAPLAVAAALVATVFTPGVQQRETFRSFFGVHELRRTDDGRFLTLTHGTTIHGAMRVANDDGTPALGRPEPTSYYTYEGAIGTAIASVRRRARGSPPLPPSASARAA
jgi:hypothetical protein